MESFISGEKIKAARKSKKLSAERLGEMLDPPVTYAAIYAWEKGKNEPSLNYVSQICAILDIAIYEIVNLPTYVGETYQEEMARYMAQMTKPQRNAMLGVAKAMVE